VFTGDPPREHLTFRHDYSSSTEDPGHAFSGFRMLNVGPKWTRATVGRGGRGSGNAYPAPVAASVRRRNREALTAGPEVDPEPCVRYASYGAWDNSFTRSGWGRRGLSLAPHVKKRHTRAVVVDMPRTAAVTPHRWQITVMHVRPWRDLASSTPPRTTPTSRARWPALGSGPPGQGGADAAARLRPRRFRLTTPGLPRRMRVRPHPAPASPARLLLAPEAEGEPSPSQSRSSFRVGFPAGHALGRPSKAGRRPITPTTHRSRAVSAPEHTRIDRTATGSAPS